jgi:hypothetical protein
MSEQLPTPEAPKFTEAQELALQRICERYKVNYSPDHYFRYPDDSFMMPGWCEGWVGGMELQQERRTLYIGVSPEGECHS